MITCEIIKDLLPAYAAGMCSRDKRKEVEDHIASCASCAKALWAITEPTTTVVIGSGTDTEEPEVTIDPVGTGGSAEAGDFGDIEKQADDGDDETAPAPKSGAKSTAPSDIKKILRRTLIVLICLALIVPLAGLGMLTYNEKRGEGYAFSNLSGLRDVDHFMKCLQKDDYAGAFSYFDVESMYWVFIPQQESAGFFVSDYRLVGIGGANYYVPIGSSLLGSAKAAEPYKEPGTDAPFWAQVIIDDVNNGHESPIPEQAFDEAARIASERLGEEVRSVDILSEEPDSPYTYIRYYAQDGSVYFRSTANGRLSDVNWMNASLVPELLLPVYIRENNREIEERNEKNKAFRDLGADGYTELVKEKYIAGWNELALHGIRIKEYSIGRPYRYSERLDPWIDPDVNAPITETYWLVSVKVLIAWDHDADAGTPPNEYKEVFTFEINEEHLDATGFVTVYITPDYQPGSILYLSQSVGPNYNVMEEDARTSFADEGLVITVETY